MSDPHVWYVLEVEAGCIYAAVLARRACARVSTGAESGNHSVQMVSISLDTVCIVGYLRLCLVEKMAI